MKNIIALLLVAVMALSMAACGTTTPAETTGTTAAVETTVDTTPVETTEDTTPVETTEGTIVAAENAASKVLNTIWALYTEDTKFFSMGGDYNAPVDGAAGVVDVTATDFLTFSLIVPEAEVANIAEAASLLHAMNANTFTGGAYVLAEGADQAAFVAAMQTAIQGNQWMCGFPETLLIAKCDGVIVVAFGNGEVMSTFNTNLTAAYAEAEILVNEAIGG